MCSGILPHCCLVAARATPPAPTRERATTLSWTTPAHPPDPPTPMRRGFLFHADHCCPVRLSWGGRACRFGRACHTVSGPSGELRV
jgi:hypothetical protein